MDQFIVSARKYRPQNFSTVVGQAHITTTLKNAIKNQQLAHAFLFCGPRGVGKTTCARILAKTINCLNASPDGEACNECHSCVSFNEGSSLNIHELDAASNNSVDDIRALVDQVRFAPQAGKYKVYIIDEVHMLSSSAFNAFLKTLEEPPSYAIFILATTEKHKILPTILSRCQIFDFKRITNNDTVEHLEDICGKEAIRAEKSALQLIAGKSEGCMRDSLSILDKIVSFTNGEVTYANTLEHLNILDADYYFKLLDALYNQDLGGALLMYDEINRKGFEGDMVLNGFSEFIRNLMVCTDERMAPLLEVVEGFREKYAAAAKTTSLGWLVSALNLLNEAEIQFRGARNKRLHVELAFIKLCYLQQAIELVQEEGGIQKKKRTEAPAGFRLRPIRGVKQTVPPKESGAKLLIETAPGTETASPVAEPVAEQPAAPMPVGKIGRLNNIRQQIAQKNNTGQTTSREPLEQKSLTAYWKQFALVLKELKNTAYQSFDLAELRISGESEFEVVVTNNLHQKFIEGQRHEAMEYLKEQTGHPKLRFSLVIEERDEDKIPLERPLNSREQFLKMAEQYPLVKELKERLRLDIRY